MYKFLSIFFVILFSQNTQASSTISGKQISEFLKSWLDDKGKPANFEILETIKYPYCETPNLIISDVSSSSIRGPRDMKNHANRVGWNLDLYNKFVRGLNQYSFSKK